MSVCGVCLLKKYVQMLVMIIVFSENRWFPTKNSMESGIRHNGQKEKSIDVW
jgi:hypothetical protein